MKTLIGLLLLLSHSPQTRAQSGCAVGGQPFLWMMKACSVETGIKDEIEIQGTACFKTYILDLNKEKCAVNEKYKRKVCELLFEKEKKYTSVEACLSDSSLKAFVISD